MPTVLELLRQSVETKAFPPAPKPMPSLDELRRSEWCPRFEQLMRNRLLMGAFRYETFEEKLKMGNRYDCVGSMIRRLELYRKTRNLEPLVDVANLCMVEFIQAEQAGATLEAADDGHHVERIA